MIRYECRSCGALLESPDSLAGEDDTCPTCGHANRVPVVLHPVPKRSAGTWGIVPEPPPVGASRSLEATGRNGMIGYVCAQCGQSMSSPDSLEGKPQTCPTCGAQVSVPRAHDRPLAGARRHSRLLNHLGLPLRIGRVVVSVGALGAIAALCLFPPWLGKGMYLNLRTAAGSSTLLVPDDNWWPLGHHPLWSPPTEHRWDHGVWVYLRDTDPNEIGTRWFQRQGRLGLRPVRIDTDTLAVECVPAALLFLATALGPIVWRRRNQQRQEHHR